MSYGTDARGGGHAQHAEAVRSAVLRPLASRSSFVRKVALLAVLSCAALAVAVVRSSGVRVEVAVLLRSEKVSNADVFTVDVTNEYTKHGESSSAYKYPFLHGVSSALLVEPHVESALRISSPAFGASYAWTFEGGLAQVGSSITVSPEGTGLQSLSVVETVGGAVSRERLFTCYIKYVRRELRQLSARDRERFLDASATLWRVDTLEGRALYGDEYVGIHHLAIIHNDLAGNPICDFIHGETGYAFGNAHAALNGMLEQSLQAVDPRVSLAYWDYTLDFWERVDRGVGGELLRVGHDLLKLWDSDVFSAKFFGASDLETGVITTGRWAHSAVPVVSEQLYVHAGFTSPWVKQGFATCFGQSDLVCDGHMLRSFTNLTYHMANSFGLLRAPWNMRAEATVVRSNRMCGASNNDQFPSCTAVIAQQRSYATWSEYILALMFSPHGTVHVFTGGAFGDCSEVYSQTVASIVKNDTILHMLQMDSSNLQKNFWMSYVSVCPERSSCAGLEQGDCVCACPSLSDFDGDDVSDENVTSSGLWSLLLSTVNFQDEDLDFMLALSTRRKIDLLHALCETDVLTGEMMGSNSPLDVTFFATHAEVERMAQRAFLSGNITDMTWPDAATVGSCPGQRAAYELVWFNYKLDTPLETTELTNVQWRDILNPANPEYATHVPYIYENFEWEHCLNYLADDGAQIDNSLMMPTDWIWLKDERVTLRATAAAHERAPAYLETTRPVVSVSSQSAAAPPDVDALVSLSQKGKGTTLTSCRAACNCTDQGSPVLAGADVVEYFARNRKNTPLMGSSEFAAAHKGFTFHFVNDDNRATFMADPSFYAPQLGGFCAYGIASEYAANGFYWSKTNLGPPVSPAAYRIYDKKLFMFIDEDVIESFESAGIQDSIDTAQDRWAEWFGDEQDRPYNSRCVCSLLPNAKDCHN